MFTSFLKNILKIVFPNKCLKCLNYSDQLICKSCFDSLIIHQHFICPKCHKTFINLNHTECYDNNFEIQSILCALDYQNPLIKDMVHKFKYQHLLSLKNVFKNVLNKSLLIHKQYLYQNNFIIVPVPLHKYKEKIRGFNQSSILAKLISEITDLKTYDNVLIRFKNNQPQAKLNNNLERQKNVSSIFKINVSYQQFIKNKKIILIDDVFTTGSTLNECAKILKQNGANTVIAICLAR